MLAQLEHVKALEKRLRKAANTLRADSVYAGNEYFLPIVLVFLRHAYGRSLNIMAAIEANLPQVDSNTRTLTAEGISRRTAISLKPEVQFGYLVFLPYSEDRAKKMIEAMESIEKDYASLQCALPKSDQVTDGSRNMMGQVKILREQKKQLVQAGDQLLPRLMSGEVAA